jgi:hypothetical protein
MDWTISSPNNQLIIGASRVVSEDPTQNIIIYSFGFLLIAHCFIQPQANLVITPSIVIEGD